MSEVLIVGFAVVAGAGLWLLGVCVYLPDVPTAIMDWNQRRRARRLGPAVTSAPIEDIAADLRRLLHEHDRLVRSPAEWHRAHHLRACELALDLMAEEAATALGLPPRYVSGSGWTTTDLGFRLHQLATAGLVLPQTAGLGGDRI